jgi:hypothetical protein
MKTLRGFMKWIFRQYYYTTFVLNTVGNQHGLLKRQKFDLFRKIRKNVDSTPGGTDFEQHLLLAEELLKLPKELEGDVVECGSWRGTSAASMSLVCKLIGRQLYVCDSFEGLPEPRTEEERYDIHAHSKESYYVWEKGEYGADLDTVKQTIMKFGDISVCHFVKGYFEDSLKNIEVKSIVAVFEDADLASSVEDCLRYLWPKMSEGARFYSNEPWSEHVVALFYNKNWWKETFNSHIPGFYGSGGGILAGLEYSGIGYTEKFDAEKLKRIGKKRVTDGSIRHI